ncbi:MAG: hypothetical protein KGL16_13630 [Acidobacteriota bacterium]|nr:hypothetical protein [Acidobacteriota bacterium]
MRGPLHQLTPATVARIVAAQVLVVAVAVAVIALHSGPALGRELVGELAVLPSLRAGETFTSTIIGPPGEPE